MTDARIASYAALLLRLSLGILFVSHAALKIFVFTPVGTVAYFGSLGLPAALAYVTMFGEFFGGIALILGIWTRPVSLLLIPFLAGAIFTVHNGAWLFSAPGGGWEFPAFWIVTLLVQALLGNGAYALRIPALTGRQPAYQ
jgi:putative oxidoreductase